MAKARERYSNLSQHRQQFLQRARHNALLTLPGLMPLDGHSQDNHLIEPYQGLGSRAVVHLASRMATALLPSGRPYMRLDLPPEERMKTEGEVDEALNKGLALSEQLIQSEVERAGWRSTTFQSLQQLIVAGNVCEHVLPDNSLRLFRLDQYVVRRDHRGVVAEAVIEELFEDDTLPFELQGLVTNNPPVRGAMDKSNPSRRDTHRLYTWIRLVTDQGVQFYRSSQELNDVEVPDSVVDYRIDKLPYLFLRWSATPGEDYGRSKCEEHVGDLRTLEALEKSGIELAAMASRNIIALRPGSNAGGLRNRITQARNGDVVLANPEDIAMLTFDNIAGAQITQAQVQALRESLGQGFLLFSAGQRDAERVTATEIERDIAELEAALGGNFSTLSGEMMERRTTLLIDQMQLTEKLPPWEEGVVTPVILTGLEALSRERDVARAEQAANIVAAFGETAINVVKLEKILSKAFIGLGFPDAVRTPEEVAAIQQQQAQQAAQQSMIDQAAQLANVAAKGQQPNG